MLLSRYKVDTEGKTGYEKRRGRRCNTPLAIFGEAVWYKQLEKEKGRQKFDVKWHQGVWLGHSRTTNEALIGTADGVIKAYACKRLPEAERWNAKMVEDMHGGST